MSRSLATESLLARYRVPIRFRFGCSASGSGGSFHNRVSVPRRECSEMYRTRHSQRAVISCEQLLMSYDVIQCHHGGRYQCRRHSGCCGSGVAASMGESATAMGRGRAVGPMRVSARRPRPTGRSGLQLARGTRVVTRKLTGTSSTSGAVDRDWPLRWANRRRQWPADVRCARCRHRPVGPGRRDGPAAGPRYSSGPG
jgi:hypothetical protein